jgi:preprotein translocase subunit SecF
LALSLVALCRIPVGGFEGMGIVVATAIGGALSMATVNRYNEERKVNAALSNAEIIDKVAKTEKGKYIMFTVATALVAVALIVVGMPYGAFAGLQLLVGAVSGTFSAYLGSGFIWSAVKK